MSAGSNTRNTPLRLAPGARVLIRDAEWIVRRVDKASDGGQQLVGDGLSELVRDKTAYFLTRLEPDIRLLDPAETELVQDDSSSYRRSLLYMESLLRQTVPNDERIHIAHQAAMDVVPYQLDPALQALKQPRQRILIADAVGLGKTLEAGILVTELIQRGRGKRILVLTLKSMLTQFQKEFWNRFTIPLTRLDSIGLQRVRSRIPSNHNPFYYYDKTIISIDTLKQDSEYRVYLENAYWDIIIIDEAHNVAERGGGSRSQRARLARLLATRSDTLIMLSATPHDGRARSFASLMNMLDPTAIADPEHYDKDDFRNKGLVIRRFKKDIQDQVDSAFKERQVFRHHHPASAEEEAAYAALLDIPFTRQGNYDAAKPQALLRISLQKALFSSPAACRDSVRNRIGVLQRQQQKNESREADKAIAAEIDALQQLDRHLSAITPERYSKYQALLTLLRSAAFGWTGKVTDDRLVIFSERIETLHFLSAQLSADLNFKDRQVAILHGGLSDIEQQSIVEDFGRPESPLRLLLCSDVAAEGINLHYLAHRLVHFDLPWSLMVFQQRNGRIDRYGQAQIPRIDYLITNSANPTIRGDTRILEVLQQKDDQAYQNIGDPSAFMHVYDVQKEEEITADAMAAGKIAESFDAALQPVVDEGEELLALFLGTADSSAAAAPDPVAAAIDSPVSLFASNFAFAKAALTELNARGESLQVDYDETGQQINLVAPDDLRYRFSLLPREIVPDDWRFQLSEDQAAIRAEIARSRQDESAWPKLHYLWPLHPLMQWLNDRMLISFGRHKAPVLELPAGLAADESVFIISGQIPNRKAQPLVYDWLAVCFQGRTFRRIESFAALRDRTGLGQQTIPNRGQSLQLEPLRELLPQAVAQAHAEISKRRDAFEAAINDKLNAQVAELDRLRERQYRQLERELGKSTQVDNLKVSRRAQRRQAIDKVFDDYYHWIEDTLTTEREPYLQVVAVLLPVS
ncbi:MAG: DEAD/DEAH box helicase [Candidatus Competibacteraceae bacterium]|nr:DEAD/DEAH box helicase [Candidatus Competibacteraceae bacterium]